MTGLRKCGKRPVKPPVVLGAAVASRLAAAGYPVGTTKIYVTEARRATRIQPSTALRCQ